MIFFLSLFLRCGGDIIVSSLFASDTLLLGHRIVVQISPFVFTRLGFRRWCMKAPVPGLLYLGLALGGYNTVMITDGWVTTYCVMKGGFP